MNKYGLKEGHRGTPKATHELDRLLKASAEAVAEYRQTVALAAEAVDRGESLPAALAAVAKAMFDVSEHRTPLTAWVLANAELIESDEPIRLLLQSIMAAPTGAEKSGMARLHQAARDWNVRRRTHRYRLDPAAAGTARAEAEMDAAIRNSCRAVREQTEHAKKSGSLEELLETASDFASANVEWAERHAATGADTADSKLAVLLAVCRHGGTTGDVSAMEAELAAQLALVDGHVDAALRKGDTVCMPAKSS